MSKVQDETAENEFPSEAVPSPSQRNIAWSRQGKPENNSGVVGQNENCGKKARSSQSGDGKRIDLKSIPVGVRLSVPQRTHLEKILEKIEKPEGRVPRTFLPKWPVMSMDNKIPYINCPYTLMYYSRGKLGENLWRKGQDYYLYDPELRNRVIGESYNALHDPHARNYLKTPVVQEKLLEQGLINQRGEVLCSQAEFNKFRNYLRNLYTAQVTAALFNADQAMLNENMQMRRIRKEIHDTEGKGAVASNRSAFSKAYTLQQEKERLENYALKQAEDAERMESIRRSREEMHMLRILRGLDHSQVQKERMHEYYMRQQLRREMLISCIAVKEKTAAERREHDEQVARMATRQYQIEYLDSKFDFGEEMLQKQQVIAKAFEDDIKRKTIKRQKRMEHERAVLPEIVAKRKKAAKRLEDIVRKYAMRWLEKVRQRKKRKPDAMHLSLWETNVILDETNKYLRQESGYEKLDDFILSIIKLKEEIRAQLEAEERAEAAAAAEEEEGARSDNEEEASEPISPEDLVVDILEDIIDNATSLYASNVVEKFVGDFMDKVKSKCSKALHLNKDQNQPVEKIQTEETEKEIPISSPDRKTRIKRKVRGKTTVTLSQVSSPITQVKSENIVVAQRNLECLKAKSIQSDSGIVSDWSAPVEIPCEENVDTAREKKSGDRDEHQSEDTIEELYKNQKNLPSTRGSEYTDAEILPPMEASNLKEKAKDVNNEFVENIEKPLYGKRVSGFHIISEVESSVSEFIAKSEIVLEDILARNSVFSSKSSYSDFSSDFNENFKTTPDMENYIDHIGEKEREISRDSFPSPQESASEENENDGNATQVGQNELETEENVEEKSTNQERSPSAHQKYSVDGPLTNSEVKVLSPKKHKARKQFFDSILRKCCSEVISLEKYVQITSRKKPVKKAVSDLKKFPKYRIMKKDLISPRTKQNTSVCMNELFLTAGVSKTNVDNYHETRGLISSVLGNSKFCEKKQSSESLLRPFSATYQDYREQKTHFLRKTRISSPLPSARKPFEDYSNSRNYSGGTARSTWSTDYFSDADIDSYCGSEGLKGKPVESLKRSPSQTRVIGGPYLSTPFISNRLQIKVKCTAKSDKSDTSIQCENGKRSSVKYIQFEVPTSSRKSNSNVNCKSRSSSCTLLPPLQLDKLPKSRREFCELISPSPQTEKCDEKVFIKHPVKIRGTLSGTRLPSIGPFCQMHLKKTEEIYKPRKQPSFTKLPPICLNSPRRPESSSSFLSVSSKDYLLKDKHCLAKTKVEYCGSHRSNSTISSNGYESIQPVIPSAQFSGSKFSVVETDSLSGDYLDKKQKSKRKNSYLPSIINSEQQLAARDEEIIDMDSKWIKNKPINKFPEIEVLGRALLIVEHSLKRMILPDVLKYMFDDELAGNINATLLTHEKKGSGNPMLTNIAKISFSMAKDCGNFERVVNLKNPKDNISYLEIYGTKYSQQIQNACLSVALSILNHIYANEFETHNY